jgi:hypothetical protein
LKPYLAAWGGQPFRQSYLKNLGIEAVHRYGPADYFEVALFWRYRLIPNWVIPGRRRTSAVADVRIV